MKMSATKSFYLPSMEDTDCDSDFCGDTDTQEQLSAYFPRRTSLITTEIEEHMANLKLEGLARRPNYLMS